MRSKNKGDQIMKSNQPPYEPDYGDLNDEEIKLVNEYIKQWESEQHVIDMQREGHSAYCRESLYWDAMVMVRMKRMYENEEYRLKIAKMLS